MKRFLSNYFYNQKSKLFYFRQYTKIIFCQTINFVLKN